MSNDNVKLDLRRDWGTFLQGVDDVKDQQSILSDLKTLTGKSQLEFSSYDEMVDAILPTFSGSSWGDYISSHVSSRPILTQAKRFFDSVNQVYPDSEDVLYYEPTAASDVSHSAYVFVNYKSAPATTFKNLLASDHAADLFAPEKSGAQEVAIPASSLGEFTKAFTPEEQTRVLSGLVAAEKRQARISSDVTPVQHHTRLLKICNELAATKNKYVVTSKDFFKGFDEFVAATDPALSSTQIGEAMSWYLSFELGWMKGSETNPNRARNGEDKIKVILDSFDPSVVAQRTAKFDSFYLKNKGRFERYYEFAKSVVEKSDELQNLYSIDMTTERAADIIMLFILIESNGDENVVPNGSHYGLMQISGDLFTKYYGHPLSVKQMQDPKTNITVGTDYFLKTCFEINKIRNPNEILSLAMTNYNWGEGAALSYRTGKPLPSGKIMELKSGSQPYNYLRDLIIYERLKKEKGLEEQVIFERY